MNHRLFLRRVTELTKQICCRVADFPIRQHLRVDVSFIFSTDFSYFYVIFMHTLDIFYGGVTNYIN